METRELIEALQNAKRIAVVGLSKNRERPAYRTTKYLIAKGYEIIPVNPVCETVLGRKCYPDIASIGGQIDIVNIFRRSEFVVEIVNEAVKAGAKFIWMQEGIVNEEAAAIAHAAGIPVVMDSCIYKVHSAHIA